MRSWVSSRASLLLFLAAVCLCLTVQSASAAIPTLSNGVPLNGSAAAGSSAFFRIDVPAGKVSLLAQLQCTRGSGYSLTIHQGSTTAPSAFTWDYNAPNYTQYSAEVKEPAAGAYFIEVRNTGSTVFTFTITAKLLVAESLAYSTTKSGVQLNRIGDVRYYKLSVASSAVASLQAYLQTTATAYDFSIHQGSITAPNADIWGEWFTGGQYVEVKAPAIATYYLVVRNKTTGTLTYSLTPYLRLAKVLGSGQATGTIPLNRYGEVAYYKITVPAGTTSLQGLLKCAGNYRFSMRQGGVNGVSVGFGGSSGDQEYCEQKLPAAGVYYLEVRNRATTATNFSLIAWVRNAELLRGNEQIRSVTLGRYGEARYYKVTVRHEETRLRADLTGTLEAANYRIKLYAGDITTPSLYTSSGYSGKTCWEQVANPSQGTYFIEVRSNTTAANQFALRVTGADFSKPDLICKRPSDAAYTGVGAYNTDQTLTQVVRRGIKATYYVLVVNHGNMAERIRMTAAPSGAIGEVKFFNSRTGTTEITSNVLGTGWLTPSLAPEASYEIRAEVTLAETVAGNAERELLVTGTSTNDGTRSDTVTLVTRRAPLTEVTLTVSPQSPQKATTRITLTGAVNGGAPEEYLFRIGAPTATGYTWTVLRNYAALSSCTWQPTTPGTYMLAVWAREIGSQAGYQAYATQSFTVESANPALTAVALSVAPASPQLAGKPITLTATPTGGTTVEYQFRAGLTVNSVTTWTVLQAFGSAATCTWTPAQAGAYTLEVTAREAGASAVVLATKPFTITPPITGIAVSANLAAPQPANTAITLSAAATGGAQVEYKFRVGYLENGQWQWPFTQEYSTSATCVWTPQAARNYRIVASVREAGTTVAYAAYKTLDFLVTVPITSINLTATPASGVARANTPVTLTTTVIGGNSLQYKYRIGRVVNGSTTWSVLQDYPAAASVTWTPDAAGTYTLVVWIRETGSTDQYQAFKAVGNFVVAP